MKATGRKSPGVEATHERLVMTVFNVLQQSSKKKKTHTALLLRFGGNNFDSILQTYSEHWICVDCRESVHMPSSFQSYMLFKFSENTVHQMSKTGKNTFVWHFSSSLFPNTSFFRQHPFQLARGKSHPFFSKQNQSIERLSYPSPKG